MIDSLARTYRARHGWQATTHEQAAMRGNANHRIAAPRKVATPVIGHKYVYRLWARVFYHIRQAHIGITAYENEPERKVKQRFHIERYTASYKKTFLCGNNLGSGNSG